MYFLACDPNLPAKPCEMAHWSMSKEIAFVSEKTISKKSASMITMGIKKLIGKEQKKEKKSYEKFALRNEEHERVKWTRQQNSSFLEDEALFPDDPNEKSAATAGAGWGGGVGGVGVGTPQSLQSAQNASGGGASTADSKAPATSLFVQTFQELPRETRVPVPAPTPKPTQEKHVLTGQEIVAERLIKEAAVYGITLLPAQASVLLSVSHIDLGTTWCRFCL